MLELRRHRDVDEDDLYEYAQSREISEYELFCIAARRWRVSLENVHDDFKEYLWRNAIPFYVRDLINSGRDGAAPAQAGYLPTKTTTW